MKHILPEFGLQHMAAISAHDIQTFVNSFAGTSKSQITLVVGIVRDMDYTGSVAKEGGLKTKAAVRYVPIPPELKERLLACKGANDEYVFHTRKGKPLPQSGYKRMWHRLMYSAGCVEWRDVKDNKSRPDDILGQLKPTLTPHYSRHNYMTMLYQAGVDPVVAMRIVGRSDYQTTANIYTHIRDETMRQASVSIDEVFQKKTEKE